MNRYFLIAILSGMLSSFSQILLKKSALKQYDTFLKQYLNPLVIGGYGITALCMVLTILAYRGMPYKYGAVIESLTYNEDQIGSFIASVYDYHADYESISQMNEIAAFDYLYE